MVYLDANASEPLRPEARAAVIAALDLVGNPSSVHGSGRAARRMLEAARGAIAARFGAMAEGVVFTSGGTEANTMAIRGFGQTRPVIIGATEHDAVRACVPDASVLPVDSDGVIRLEVLERLLRAGPALVCVMLANNETGTLQPIREAAALCRQVGAVLHVDAVQARDGADLRALGAHSLAVSSHKLGGPTGAGALILAELDVGPLLPGGGQERGRRGGTPGLPAIAGFAAAAAAPRAELFHLRQQIEAVGLTAGAKIMGGARRLGNTVCLALPGVAAGTQVISLDLAGVQVSAGAACSSGKVGRSAVLAAMGHGNLAGEAIRVSLPWSATSGDVVQFERAYNAMAHKLAQRQCHPSTTGSAPAVAGPA